MCVFVCVCFHVFTQPWQSGESACTFKFHSCSKVYPTQLQFLRDICIGACDSKVKSETNCILANRSLMKRCWWLEASIFHDRCSSSQHQTEDRGFGSGWEETTAEHPTRVLKLSNTRFTLEPRITPKLAFKTPPWFLKASGWDLKVMSVTRRRLSHLFACFEGLLKNLNSYLKPTLKKA